MLAPLAALALWTGLFHHTESRHLHNDVVTIEYRVGDWRVKIADNRFSGEKRCTARRPDVAYDNGVLTFYFPKDMNTANAIFRVDWGEPRPVGDVLVAASGMGAHVQRANLENPSNGEVFIPATYVGDAALVAIKPDRATKNQVFKVAGLRPVIASLQARGCPQPN